MLSTGKRIDLSTLKFGAILNTSSGQCELSAKEEVEGLLASHGIRSPHVWCGAAEGLAAAFLEARTHMLDVLIVLGGDGTIRTAAEMANAEGPYLIPLPGGTMNMLPHALYGDRPWREVLTDTLAQPVVRTVSSGSVGVHQFFVAALFGGPTKMAEAREALREGDVTAAIQVTKNVVTEGLQKVSYEFGKKESGEAETIAVICPLVSPVMHAEEAVLEAAALNIEGVGEALRIAAATAFGRWREDPNVIERKTDRIHLTSERDIPATLDGELAELGADIQITFVPQAFKAIVPEATLVAI